MSEENDVRPPVDPMSDVSWARVERGLWARLDGTGTTQIAAPPARRWLWIALPSLAVAAGIAIVFGIVIDTPKPLPVPVVETPIVEETPTRVVSGESPSTITVGDAHVTLDPDSAVVMPRTTDSTAVLERGAAWFAIAPRTGRQFVVVAGDAVVRVIGTKFRVARSEEHATVEVERGLVDVTFQGTTVKVTAGQRWSSEAPAKVASREPKTARIVEPKRTVDETPKRVEPKATTKTPIVDDERAKFERFQAIEARDPAAALAGYLELSRGTSRWAENSLYAAARLSTDRGEPRAKILLDMYLRRYPRGANADDARQLLDRLKGAP